MSDAQKEAYRSYHRKWHSEHKAAHKARYAESRKDPSKVQVQCLRIQSWYRRNKAKKNARNVIWLRAKRQNDPQYSIRNRLASRIVSAVKRQGARKAAKTTALLGCPVAEFRAWLEAQFKPGMTWELLMRGEIHIDHKVPCALFNLSDPDQQRRCFHYTNLQPLWRLENLSKGAKMAA